MRTLFLLALLAALAGCATAPGREGLSYIDVSGASDCTVSVEDRPFVLPAEAASLEAELSRLARSKGGAIVAAGDPGPGFRCRTAFMLSLRTAGFKRIGFLGYPVEEEETPAATP